MKQVRLNHYLKNKHVTVNVYDETERPVSCAISKAIIIIGILIVLLVLLGEGAR